MLDVVIKGIVTFVTDWPVWMVIFLEKSLFLLLWWRNLLDFGCIDY